MLQISTSKEHRSNAILNNDEKAHNNDTKKSTTQIFTLEPIEMTEKNQEWKQSFEEKAFNMKVNHTTGQIISSPSSKKTSKMITEKEWKNRVEIITKFLNKDEALSQEEYIQFKKTTQ